MSAPQYCIRPVPTVTQPEVGTFIYFFACCCCNMMCTYIFPANPNMSVPQYCIKPVPTVTQREAIMELPYSYLPGAMYQQPAQVCFVEMETKPAVMQSAQISVARTLIDSPTATICPFCHESIVTRVVFQSGLLTWLLCAAIMFLGLIVGCCLIPFCVNATKNADHYCPRCNSHIFKCKRL